MVDRASTFSDPEIIRRLSSEFIPVAADTHDLQHRRTPAHDWFDTIVRSEKVREIRKQRKEGDTIQGLYIFAADGTSYGWRNNRDPRAIERFMNEAVAAFAAAPPAHVTISDVEARAAYSRPPDDSTSVVRVFARISPLPDGAHDCNERLGRDHLWILRRDVKQIVAAASAVNAPFALPAPFVARLVRFHMVDNIRGEPDMWEPKHVRRAAFRATRLSDMDGRIRCRFTGRYAMRADNPARAMKGSIEGEFEIEPGTLRITRFRAYGEARASGRSTYTPGEPVGEFPMVFAMIDVADRVSREVPPQGVSWGDREYEDARLPRDLAASASR